LELVALTVAAIAVLIAVVHQSLIGSHVIYKSRAFVLVEVLAVLTVMPLGFATLVKSIVLAFDRNRNAIISLVVAFIVGAMFLFCFWYDASTLLYAT